MALINGKDLLARGWPTGPTIGAALKAIDRMELRGLDRDAMLRQLDDVKRTPNQFIADATFGEAARTLLQDLRMKQAQIVPKSETMRTTPLGYAKWGADMIDTKALDQMNVAVKLPIARAAAVMPDAHVGYGLPIGGVLATEDAVIPYAVGVDIACRMRISVMPVSPILLDQQKGRFERALIEKTRFGAGQGWKGLERADHAVMQDDTFKMLPLIRNDKDKSWSQLGTSGGGNHFVEWGALTLEVDAPDLGLKRGKYLALLSHSGSRGLGAKIANHYSKVAREAHPHLPKEAQHLSWLDMTSEAGAEYWAAMNLAGRYAAANHEVIHDRVLAAAGLEPVAMVENHHNFAWQETLADGRSVIVHRKGATPAGKGVLGVIPGSMADPGYIVRGLGNWDSINSASHGAGRQYGRRQALEKLSKDDWRKYLNDRNVKLIGGSLDESPMAYKNIDDVMDAQRDLVERVAKFSPRIVRMADDRDRGGFRRKKKNKNRR